MADTPLGFGGSFDTAIDLGQRRVAVFGRDVLTEVVRGLDEAAARPRNERNWGPGVLGCAMRMDDAALILALRRMANACVVVTQQVAGHYDREERQPLLDLAGEVGLAQQAYPELADLAPHVDGEPTVVGPYGPMPGDGQTISGVRELGFRKVGRRLVPLVHAKLMLLGRMGWTDEHPSGGVKDTLYFVPEKLWVGSANFTTSSRRSLEMGMWLTEPDLLKAARDWLLRLVAMSEPLGTGPDDVSPALVPVEYDVDAMLEYLRDQHLEEE